MNWEDIKNRKEDSIRESTGNPVGKPIEVNGITYNSFIDYMNSVEHKEYLDTMEEAQEQYTKKAKDYFNSLETDNQLLLFFHITNTIFVNYFKDNSSYRGLLYDKFGFGPEAYSLGMDSGMFALHNAISTPEESEERFKSLIKHLDLDLSKEELISARNFFEYGFDNTKSFNDFTSKQQKFDFEKDPK